MEYLGTLCFTRHNYQVRATESDSGLCCCVRVAFLLSCLCDVFVVFVWRLCCVHETSVVVFV